MARVSFDPYAPYGPVVETTVRIATWNVWGRYGRWEDRQAGLEATLAHVTPDIVCLVESWSVGADTQAERIARRLGVGHHLFVGDWEQDGWTSGVGIVSRWPILTSQHQLLPGEGGGANGEALFAPIDGPRGPIQLFAVILDYPLNASAVRQAQVRQLTEFIGAASLPGRLLVVCGDFNAGPDSDELRMLTGRSAVAAPGMVFYDAWEMAGDGTAGYTWSNRNSLAAPALYPDRRFDYILSAWPRAGGVGHPTNCELLGDATTNDGTELSDHYGVLADVRY